MTEAIVQAKKAFDLGEVPVGSVIVFNENIIASTYNQKESKQDATAHAECLAIQEASRYLNTWRLLGCTIYTTLEPCVMCAAAIVHARLLRVVYAAKDKKWGGDGGAINVLTSNVLNHKPLVDYFENPLSSNLLRAFFKMLRQRK